MILISIPYPIYSILIRSQNPLCFLRDLLMSILRKLKVEIKVIIFKKLQLNSSVAFQTFESKCLSKITSGQDRTIWNLKVYFSGSI